MICTNHTSLLVKQKLYCGVMAKSRFQGKKGHPLLQKKMKAAVKKSQTPSGDAICKAMNEVIIIYKKLDEKHPEAYYSEQLKVWAHLISNG